MGHDDDCGGDDKQKFNYFHLIGKGQKGNIGGTGSATGMVPGGISSWAYAIPKYMLQNHWGKEWLQN